MPHGQPFWQSNAQTCVRRRKPPDQVRRDRQRAHHFSQSELSPRLPLSFPLCSRKTSKLSLTLFSELLRIQKHLAHCEVLSSQTCPYADLLTFFINWQCSEIPWWDPAKRQFLLVTFSDILGRKIRNSIIVFPKLLLILQRSSAAMNRAKAVAQPTLSLLSDVKSYEGNEKRKWDEVGECNLSSCTMRSDRDGSLSPK